MAYYNPESCAPLDIACYLRNIEAYITYVKDTLVEKIEQGLQLGYDTIQRITYPIIQAIQTCLYTFQREANAWWKKITDAISSVVQGVQQIYDWLINNLGSILARIEAAVQDWLRKVAELWQAIEGWFSETWAKIKDWIETTWDKIKDLYTSIITWIKENVGGWIQDALNWIKTAFDWVRDWIAELSNKVWGWIEGAVTTIKTKIEDVIKWVGEELDKVVGIIEAGFKEMEEMFSTLIEDFIRFFQDLWVDVRNYLDNLFRLDEDTFTRAFKLIQSASMKVSREFGGQTPQ
jgi:phage-related protein